MRIGLLLASLMATASLLTASAGAQDKASEAATDPVIAVVNGTELHKSDLVASYDSLPEQYRQMPIEAIYDPLLQRLVDGQLILDHAETENLAGDPAVATAIVRARADVLREWFIQRQVDARLTPEKLAQAYEARRKQPGFAQEEVHARHILVETEETAKAVIAELDGGADFIETAKARSTGPTGPNGGDLGYFKRDAMVPEFGAAAFAMEPGTYSSAPVKTQFGWHVIKLEDKRMTEPAFAEVEESLRQEMVGQTVNDILASVREGANVTRFAIDGSPVEPTPAETAPTEAAPAEAAPAAQ